MTDNEDEWKIRQSDFEEDKDEYVFASEEYDGCSCSNSPGFNKLSLNIPQFDGADDEDIEDIFDSKILSTV